jgi:DNA-binding beta-propeller fold protein YncE
VIHSYCPCFFPFFFAGTAFAPTLGVYDCRGVLLVPLSALKTVTATLFGKEYIFEVAQDGSAVILTCCTTTDDQDAQCKAFGLEYDRKVRKCKEDAETAQQEITAKQQEIEDSYSEEMDASNQKCQVQELQCLLLQRGKHKKELSALQQQSDQKIKVTNTSCFEASELRLGQAVMIRPHRKVCMFLNYRPEWAVSWGWKDTTVGSIVYSACEKQTPSLCLPILPWSAKNGVHSIATTSQFVFLSFPGKSHVAQYLLSGAFVKLIGATGSIDEGKLVRPLGIATRKNTLLVADEAEDHVCVYNIQLGTLRRHIGTTATTPRPTDVAVNDHRVYVAAGKSGVHGYIYEYLFTKCKKTAIISMPGRSHYNAEAVAIYEETVYITYTGITALLKFNIRGTFMGRCCLLDEDTSAPMGPEEHVSGILVGPQYIFVARPTRGRVEVYQRTSSQFLMVLTTDKTAAYASPCPRLTSVALGPDGGVWVTNAQDSCVHKIDIALVAQKCA